MRPKPHFDSGNRNQGLILVSEPKKISETETFSFQMFFSNSSNIFSSSLWNLSICILENEPKSLKDILKYLIFGSKFGFGGPFMMEKIPIIYIGY